MWKVRASEWSGCVILTYFTGVPIWKCWRTLGSLRPQVRFVQLYEFVFLNYMVSSYNLKNITLPNCLAPWGIDKADYLDDSLTKHWLL